MTNSHWKLMQHFKSTILPIKMLKIKKKNPEERVSTLKDKMMTIKAH